MRELCANSRFGMVLLPLPSVEKRLADAKQTRPVCLIILPERAIKKPLRLVTRNRGVPEVELELPMNVGELHIVEHPPLFPHLPIQRGTWHRRIQHELMKIRAIGNGVVDVALDVLRRVVLQPDYCRSQHLIPWLRSSATIARVTASFSFGVTQLPRFQPDPDPGDPQAAPSSIEYLRIALIDENT